MPVSLNGPLRDTPRRRLPGGQGCPDTSSGIDSGCHFAGYGALWVYFER
jgi:hypothetical protein